MFYTLQLTVFAAVTILLATLTVLLGLVDPYGKVVYRINQFWTWIILRAGGISLQVSGLENIDPACSYVFMVNHQSNVDIPVIVQSLLPFQLRWIAKKELLWVPFFGWAMASTQMISIDRSKGRDAFEQVVEQGADRLARGWWIVIFPEGTRTPPGSTRRYKTGGARLAARTGAFAVPIAVNSGEFWPRQPLIKAPGTITVSIGPPIDPRGKTADEVGALVESWIETEMRRLAPHRYDGPYMPLNRAGAVAATSA